MRPRIDDQAPDCARFQRLLPPLLEGSLADGERSWMEGHRLGCTTCQDRHAERRETDRLLGGWQVPGPPPQLGERILRAVRRGVLQGEVHCSDVRADLDARRADDLSAVERQAFADHVAHCAPCAHQVALAERVDALLAGWQAPVPPAGLRERTLDAWLRAAPDRRSRPARPRAGHAVRPRASRGPGRRRAAFRSWVWLAPVAAAATILVVALLGQRGGSPGDRRTVNAVPTAVQDLLSRYGREVRVHAVAFEQFPDGIGAFDPQPAVVDRVRRSSGNAFHRSMRRALAEAALAEGDR